MADFNMVGPMNPDDISGIGKLIEQSYMQARQRPLLDIGIQKAQMDLEQQKQLLANRQAMLNQLGGSPVGGPQGQQAPMLPGMGPGEGASLGQAMQPAQVPMSASPVSPFAPPPGPLLKAPQNYIGAAPPSVQGSQARMDAAQAAKVAHVEGMALPIEQQMQAKVPPAPLQIQPISGAPSWEDSYTKQLNRLVQDPYSGLRAALMLDPKGEHINSILESFQRLATERAYQEQQEYRLTAQANNDAAFHSGELGNTQAQQRMMAEHYGAEETNWNAQRGQEDTRLGIEKDRLNQLVAFQNSMMKNREANTGLKQQKFDWEKSLKGSTPEQAAAIVGQIAAARTQGREGALIALHEDPASLQGAKAAMDQLRQQSVDKRAAAYNQTRFLSQLSAQGIDVTPLAKEYGINLTPGGMFSRPTIAPMQPAAAPFQAPAAPVSQAPAPQMSKAEILQKIAALEAKAAQ